MQGLRVDRTISELLRSKRDLWDRRDSSTPVAMVDLLKRIYKAELIKPESRNYLRVAWWAAILPGATLTVTVISLTALGRRLQRRFEGRR